ncbi:hypothetical protein [Ruminococcus sp.]|uniref:hypothetical protein n=1 Tax=Ruminococcus sp. TaxID=41978 RepID=UPI0025CEB165|nr:hypothetical protein [Ruminococcus sp.]MBQ8966405.1 hypothetical protein [Ruminococcus sp.]
MTMRAFYLTDILHTGHHGVEYTPKVGEKYDERRGKIMLLDDDKLEEGQRFPFVLYSEDENGGMKAEKFVRATYFERMYAEGDRIFLRTLNSIYVLKEAEAEVLERIKRT